MMNLKNFLIFVYHFSLANAAAKTTSDKDTSASATNREAPFRHRNLDYWDADTLAAYLSISPTYPHEIVSDTKKADDDTSGPIYAGNDAAILFYAQWCQNCHSLAPMWDQISGLIHAGTTQSNVIMALFDCEQKDVHKSLCSAIGITHYPTMLYVGKGTYHDTDPITSVLMGKDRSAGPMGKSILPQTVKFQGDWRYGDQILDWISIMKGISSYNKWMGTDGKSSNVGFAGKVAKWLIRPFSPFKGKAKSGGGNKNDQMPIGIPPGHQLEVQKLDLTEATEAWQKDALAQTTKLEGEIKALKDEKEQIEQGSSHFSLLIDLMLFPDMKSNKANDTTTMNSGEDAFTILSQTWDDYPKLGEKLLDATNTDKTIPLLQSCVVEMTIDYCTRFLSKNAMDEYDMLGVEGENVENREEVLAEIQARDEPFCNNIENCISLEFSSDECRPESCPLKHQTGCQYISTCVDSKMIDAYKTATESLFEELNLEVDSKETKDSSSGGWGVKK